MAVSDKLIGACLGKSNSQGGLNMDQFKQELSALFPEISEKISKTKLREDLHKICREKGLLDDSVSVKTSVKEKDKVLIPAKIEAELDVSHPKPTHKPKIKFTVPVRPPLSPPRVLDLVREQDHDHVREQELPELLVLVGFPASTKSTYARSLSNYTIVSRDQIGGTIAGLLPIITGHINSGNNVVVDTTALTIEHQQLFTTVKGARLSYCYFNTTIEDCQIRCLTRMYQRYGKIFYTADDIKKSSISDPNVFPPVVLFKARKDLHVPTGDNVKVINVPKPVFNYPNKALFLDVDGTLRNTVNCKNGKYPVSVDEVVPIVNPTIMKSKIKYYVDLGYLIIGISNQSGIQKGDVSEVKVIECMEKTKEFTGIDFPIYYCPHASFPISCYCRKPQSGLLVMACEKYHINPENSIFIGDRSTDETCAKRMSIPFIHADDFWKSKH
jgi:D-glycero-D-manno-heptose 1,7-bisphosphate phosphatase